MNTRLRFACTSLLLAAGAGLTSPASAQEGTPPPTAGSDTLDAPPPAVDPASFRLGKDTVHAAPGEVYPAGSLHRFLLGDLNRDLWHLRFPVPVLDLDEVGGGLTVSELSGGKQTLGLRFEGRDGLIYQFRSILKTASRAIPTPLRGTEVEDALQDQMAAQFPLSAMVVAELLEAAGVLVAKPRPVVMPDDPRLGEYRDEFAGRMGWIEVRPNERETEDGEEYVGFAGSDKITGSEALYEELIDDPESYVDAPALLRARLVDMLVGDWDRHSDQWRWASYPDGERTRWVPIPRDRDWALSRIDGLLPAITRMFMPKYTGFSNDVPDVFRMHWSAQRVDRMLLSPLSRSDFAEAAAELTEALDDDTIERAVGVLPPSYQETVGDELRSALQLRRDALSDYAMEYYELLSGHVNVWGTEEVDSLHVEPAGGGGMRVRLYAPREGPFVRYERVFDPSDTEEVRVYLGEGDDIAVLDGDPAIRLRVVTGDDDDVVRGAGSGSNLLVYDTGGDDEVEVGDDAVVTERDLLGQDSIRTAYFTWETRDWGTSWLPRPEVWYDADLGFYAGGGVTRYGFGFGQTPYESKLSASILNGFDAAQWIVDLDWTRAMGDAGWWVDASLQSRTDEPVWLYGFGNGVPAPVETREYRSERSSVTGRIAARYRVDEDWHVSVGPEWSIANAVKPGGIVFDSLDAYGTGEFNRVGLSARLEVDTRDASGFPTRGRTFVANALWAPSLLDVEETFSRLGLEWTEYRSFEEAPLAPGLHVRLRGERSWGQTPFNELPYLGGDGRLPGFTSRRFVGHSAASASALARLRLLDGELVTDLQFGVHAVGTAGRVWYDADDPDRWHTAVGGGAWLRIPAIDRLVSITLIEADTGLRTHLDFGFLF